jgi:hypothetical protein
LGVQFSILIYAATAEADLTGRYHTVARTEGALDFFVGQNFPKFGGLLHLKHQTHCHILGI